MQQLQTLLERYWAGELGEDERILLLDLLNAQVQAINARSDHRFEPVSDAGAPLLSDSRSGAVLQRLHERIAAEQTFPAASQEPTTPHIRKWMRPMIAAAAAILLLVIAAHLLSRKTSPNPAIPQQPVLASTLKTTVNQTQQPQELTTSDGSTILLYPGARLRYHEPFKPGERSFLLEGKALFAVAKLAGNPFTVHSGDITTTALGTKFSVETRHPGDQTQIRLLEGKVMIQSPGRKDVYLDPGQECVLNNQTGGASLVRSFIQPSNKKPAILTTKNNSENNTLEFDRMRLSEVFKKIALHYKVDIRSTDASVNRVTFTGKFLPTDKLETVLNVICNTNDLLFQQTDSLINISKLN